MNLAMVESDKHIKFIGRSHSELIHHGECCQLAQRWLTDMHRSMSFHRSEDQSFHAPLWLRRRFKWGPVQWPLSWCEAVRKKEIDCGVFAAFAREVFLQQNVDVFPAQIILKQPKSYTDHWNVKWANVFQTSQWIGEEHVYHEVIAVAIKGDTKLRIYDPTESVWLDTELSNGINCVSGINVISSRPLKWGEFTVGLGKWVVL